MTRRLAGAAVAVACVLLVTACGSSADPHSARRSITSADQHAAKLVDVQQADVPASYSPHGSQKTGRSRCAPDLSDLTLTGTDLSKPFIASDAHGYVLGEVDVYRSAAQAAAAFTRITGETRRRCLLQIARHGLAGHEAAHVRVEPRPVAVAAVRGRLIGRRFAQSWRDGGKTRVQNTDDVYMQIGRAFVVLSLWRDGSVFPQAAESKVIAAVASRALQVRG